jgi:hypothetical protein
LNRAFDWLIQYQSGDQESGKILLSSLLFSFYLHCFLIVSYSSVLTQAWEIYYNVFHQIDKNLAKVSTLELHDVSPRLLAVKVR